MDTIRSVCTPLPPISTPVLDTVYVVSTPVIPSWCRWLAGDHT